MNLFDNPGFIDSIKNSPNILVIIVLAYFFFYFVVWGLALALNHGDGLDFFDSVQLAWGKSVKVIAKNRLIFAVGLLYLLGAHFFQLADHAAFDRSSHPGQQFSTNRFLLIPLINIGTMIILTLCQLTVYKDNSAGVSKHSYNKFLACLKLMTVVVLVNTLTSMLNVVLVLPGVFASIMFFVAGPICASEGTMVMAIKRSVNLSSKHIWGVAKMAIPLTILPIVLSWIIPLAQSFLPAGIREITSSTLKVVDFALLLLIWQCQSQMQNFLVNDGETTSP